MENLVVGTAGSVLGALIISIWHFSVAPRIRSSRYRVPNIDGTVWDGYDSEDSIQPNSSLRISQRGDRIDAVVERRTTSRTRTFKYHGFLRGGQLVMTWEEPEGEGLICGAIVLKISGSLNTLIGKSVFEKLDCASVETENRFYRRVS